MTFVVNLLLLIAGFFISNSAFGESFVILESFGKVQARPPFTTKWQLIKKNDVLPENTLIKTELESSVRIAAKGKQRTFEIKLNEPTVLRLTENMLRDMQKDIVAKSKPQKSKTLVENFITDMLNSYREDLSLSQDDITNNEKLENIKYTQAAEKSKPILIYYPVDREKILMTKFPENFSLIWKNIPETKKFNVYLWSIENERGEPYGQTSNNHLDLQVLTPGFYYLQVTTSDMQYQSSILMLEFSFPNLEAEKFKKSDSKAETPSGINLLFPLDRLNIVSTKKQSINFSWQKYFVGDAPVQYLLIIENLKNHKKSIFKTNDTFATIPLAEGKYRWYIEAKEFKMNFFESYFSEINSLSIQKNLDYANSDEYSTIYYDF
ncbi:hypothetical protein MEO40_26315 [Dolichospermum sp. ST_sed1]|nr:hypothetical protein [Dolichospermum sp. ST_sed1]